MHYDSEAAVEICTRSFVFVVYFLVTVRRYTQLVSWLHVK